MSCTSLILSHVPVLCVDHNYCPYLFYETSISNVISSHKQLMLSLVIAIQPESHDDETNNHYP